MKLEAERLALIPLTAKQLHLWLEDVKALEDALNCSYRGEPVQGHFVDFIRARYLKAQSDASNYLYHTVWFIVRKTDSVVMGEIAFMGLPNENREVEIGYGLNPEFEGEGYMTEAVQTLCEWALAQKEINHVVAETENNPKSENILKRAGFLIYQQNDMAVRWRR